MKQCPVVHFEMPYEDSKRFQTYYQNVFGWQMQNMPGGDEYVLALTTPVDGKMQRPIEPGAINGGFFPNHHGSMPHLVVAVLDLVAHMDLVKKSGGNILGEVMDIPGVGKFVMTTDSENNHIGMLQPVTG